VKKADLSKSYQNPKRKLGVTTHFSEILIGPKFEKKLPYILCILYAFSNDGLQGTRCKQKRNHANKKGNHANKKETTQIKKKNGSETQNGGK